MQSMIPEKVKKVLEHHQLEALEFEPGSTPTSETAAARIGVEVGQIAKTMVFKGKDGRYFVIVCPGGRRVCSKKIRQVTGTKTRMARVEETVAVTGYQPGGVCPFAIDAPVEMYIDKGLSDYQAIYPAAGTDASGVPTTFDQLKGIIGATEVEIMEEDS